MHIVLASDHLISNQIWIQFLFLFGAKVKDNSSLKVARYGQPEFLVVYRKHPVSYIGSHLKIPSLILASLSASHFLWIPALDVFLDDFSIS